MSINTSGTNNSPRIDGTIPARGPKAPARVTSDDAPVQEASSGPSRQRDVLDLSPAARAFVARADDESPLSAERLLEIRQRVLDGAYDSPEILDAVAAKLRQSNDLR